MKPGHPIAEPKGLITPALFLAIPGLLGLALAYRMAAVEFDIPPLGGEWLALISIALWAGVLCVIRHRAGLSYRMAMTPLGLPVATTASLGGMLVAVLLVPHVPAVAAGLAAATVVALLVATSRLLQERPAEWAPPDTALRSIILSTLLLAGQICLDLGYPSGAMIAFAITTPLAAGLLFVVARNQRAGAAGSLPYTSLAFHLALAGLLGMLAARLGWRVLAVELLLTGSLLCIAALWAAFRRSHGAAGAYVLPFSMLAMGFFALAGAWVWPGLAALVVAACLMGAILGRHLWLWSAGRL